MSAASETNASSHFKLPAFDAGYDTDDTPPEEVLLWRQDPEVSLSDWTIEISYETAKKEKKTDVYHVHKFSLSRGPRQSGYFALRQQHI